MMACEYCKGEPETGWIETENNGPIVACPVCNPNGEREREWQRAEMERDRQEAERHMLETRAMDEHFTKHPHG